MGSAPTNELETIALFLSLGAWQAQPDMIHADRRPIKDEHVKHLARLPHIEHLVLGQTALTDAAMPTICAMAMLTVLDVGGTKITDAGATRLASLSKLRCLGIYGTAITDASTKTIGELSNIEMLNVNSTKITDVGLLNLTSLRNLRAIEVRDTNTTPDGISRFHEALPESTIVTDNGTLQPLT